MEWIDLLKGALSSSPLALVLAYGLKAVWAKLQEKEAIIQAKDAEIYALHEKRIGDLIRIAKLDE